MHEGGLVKHIQLNFVTSMLESWKSKESITCGNALLPDGPVRKNGASGKIGKAVRE